MDIMWDQGRWLTPNDVRRSLSETKAPTTVATVLTRLHGKGRLERRRRGKAFEYRAGQNREEYVASVMEEWLDKSYDRRVALLEFIDRLPDEDRLRLRRILRH